MARFNFIATTPSEVATGSGANKTILQIKAPSAQFAALKSVEVTFKGTDPTGTPILVLLAYQTASTGTSTGGATLTKENPAISTSVQTTATYGYSAEPSGTSIVRQWEVHPQAGLLYSFPLGDEVILNPGNCLGLIVNAAASISSVGTFRCEE